MEVGRIGVVELKIDLHLLVWDDSVELDVAVRVGGVFITRLALDRPALVRIALVRFGVRLAVATVAAVVAVVVRGGGVAPACGGCRGALGRMSAACLACLNKALLRLLLTTLRPALVGLCAPLLLAPTALLRHRRENLKKLF